MIKENLVTQKGFDALLSWLDDDRETAARKYEQIRQRLIQIFANRGCFEAEALADETINRVTLKLSQLNENYVGEPALYFYGVAHHIHQEWLRKQQTVINFEFVETDNHNDSDSEDKYECLEKCLGTLPSAHHQLIIQYYQDDKRAKIDHRKQLAEQIGISLNALQIKTYRIRIVLQKCVEKCLSSV